MFEYISPTAELVIGDQRLIRLQAAEVISSRMHPIDTAEIRLDIADYPADLATVGQAVQLWLGYRDKGLWPVFSGEIVDLSVKRVAVISARDAMERLRQIRITKTFLNSQPQEIIKFVLNRAGLTDAVLSGQTLPQKHTFVLAGANGIEAVKLVNRSWDLVDWRFYTDPGDRFYWGPWQESDRYRQDEIVTFEYGKNILDLIPSDARTGSLLTILLPFLRHSEVIQIVDQRFWGRTVTARIERINHIFGPKARTKIEWRLWQS